MQIDNLVSNLLDLASSASRKRSASVSHKDYLFSPCAGVTIPITSFKFSDFGYKKHGLFPTLARGLFIKNVKEDPRIVIRGYDKFFNGSLLFNLVGEVEHTKWDYLLDNAVGPFEVTLKENGCIIFVSNIDGYLAVSSKHSLGASEEKVTHAAKGEEWLYKHLECSNSSINEFKEYLKKENLTAVFELADDSFEEHILSYPKDVAGLYMHGLNRNTVEFESLPIDTVKNIANKFGFYCVDYFFIDHINALHDFAMECARTGCYKGKPVEGFVVRRSETINNHKVSKFFKIKFDEPYLMFREWREVTNVLLRKNTPRTIRFELTKKYIDWVSKKIDQRPDLFEKYSLNQGIILVRNLFLMDSENIEHFDGVDLKELCKEHKSNVELSSTPTTEGHNKVLILPVAAVGLGKSTLGKSLHKLFPDRVAHIQNDNIKQSKNKREIFELQIMEQFKFVDYVFADRNNHVFGLRGSLCNLFKSVYPAGTIIALDWGVDFADKKELFKFCCNRIKERGENHQNLTYGRTKDIERVIGMFIYQRDAIDLNTQFDSKIDKIIDIPYDKILDDQIKFCCNGLDLELPDYESYSKALDQVAEYVEEVKINNKQVKPKYFGVKVSSEIVLEIEKSMKGRMPPFWLKTRSKILEWTGSSAHITIVLASKKSEHKDLFEFFNNRWLESGNPNFNSELGIGAKVTFYCSKLVYNDRVCAMIVDSSSPDFPSMNKYRHVTLAVLKEDSKPHESNVLIENYYNGGITDYIEFPTTELVGNIAAFFS